MRDLFCAYNNHHGNDELNLIQLKLAGITAENISVIVTFVIWANRTRQVHCIVEPRRLSLWFWLQQK